MKINYDMMQVRRAAQFIFEHNKGFVKCQECKTWEDVEKHIINHIKEYTDERKTSIYSLTGGWGLILSINDDKTCDCEVYVNPAIGESESFNITIGE